MDVEVISKQIVKPSTPTPKHLRNYKFSFLDQISPSFYVPLIYFYDLDHNLTKIAISGELKQSLSKVLTHYYPLAGCLKDDHVDCNDVGVLLLEAQVGCNISSFIHQEPNPSELKKLLPHDHDDLKDFILGIQINFFDCGNIAIGACLSHKIADASTFITFIKNWAAVAGGGDTEEICPELLSAELFPPRDVGEASKVSLPPEKNIVCKRFMFSGSTIAALKEKYYADGIHPTRFEALSSFIWSRFTASTQIKTCPSERVFMLVLAVNLRKRMNPPQPDDSFGNISGPTTTTFPEEIGQECRGLVKNLRHAIGKINNDYAKKLQEGVFEHFGLLESSSNDEGCDEKREVVHLYYTSLCRFPLYEADFGWGKPVWVAWGGCWPYSNVAVFMDTKCGKGIETWIHFKEEDMVRFEADIELLSFVSPTSSSSSA